MASDYNKHESKYFNTARLMNQALLILLESKEYEYITISEICKKAGVNRSTFYLHYQNMDDLLKETLGYSNDEFRKQLAVEVAPDVVNDSKDDLIFVTPRYLIPYLTYVKEHKKIYLIAKSKPELFNVNSTYNNVLNSIIFPILEKFSVSEQEKKYLSAYFISGAQAIVMEWVNNNCSDDVSYVCDLIIKYSLRSNKI